LAADFLIAASYKQLFSPHILHATFAAIALRDRRELTLEISKESEFLVEVELSTNLGLN